MLRTTWRLLTWSVVQVRSGAARPFSLSLRHGGPKPLPPRPVIDEGEITEVFLHGSGPGGQKINKTSSAVQLKHLPTGMVVKCQETRSRTQNRKIARRILAEKLEVIEKGPQSRTALKAEVKLKKKASKDKKARRKYKKLAEAKEGQDVNEDGDDIDAGAAEEHRGVEDDGPNMREDNHPTETTTGQANGGHTSRMAASDTGGGLLHHTITKSAVSVIRTFSTKTNAPPSPISEVDTRLDHSTSTRQDKKIDDLPRVRKYSMPLLLFRKHTTPTTTSRIVYSAPMGEPADRMVRRVEVEPPRFRKHVVEGKSVQGTSVQGKSVQGKSTQGNSVIRTHHGLAGEEVQSPSAKLKTDVPVRRTPSEKTGNAESAQSTLQTRHSGKAKSMTTRLATKTSKTTKARTRSRAGGLKSSTSDPDGWLAEILI